MGWALILVTTLAFALAQPAGAQEVTEETILRDPLVIKALQRIYKPGRIGPTGAVSLSSGRKPGLMSQKISRDAIALGIGRRDETIIDEGVRGFEYGFGDIRDDGSFDDLGGGGRFLLAYVEAYYLLRNTIFGNQYFGRLLAQGDKAGKGARYLLQNPDFQTLMTRSFPKYTNQLLGTALLFKGIGEIVSDPDLIALGEGLFSSGTQAQWSNGVFPENGGHDSSYQAVSLQFLSFFWLGFPVYRADLQQRLADGWAWELGRIQPDGSILTDGNTRTARLLPDGTVKPVNYLEVALSLLYWVYITPLRDPTLRDIAGQVLNLSVAN